MIAHAVWLEVLNMPLQLEVLKPNVCREALSWLPERALGFTTTAVAAALLQPGGITLATSVGAALHPPGCAAASTF